MRQRNDTHDELVAWVDPVLVIGPGDVVEWDLPIVGLTILDDDHNNPPEPEDEPGEKEAAATPDYDTTEEPTP